MHLRKERLLTTCKEVAKRSEKYDSVQKARCSKDRKTRPDEEGTTGKVFEGGTRVQRPAGSYDPMLGTVSGRHHQG